MGADTLLHLRSVHLSDIWDDFWIFRTEREKKQLYSGQSIILNYSAYQDDVANAASLRELRIRAAHKGGRGSWNY